MTVDYQTWRDRFALEAELPASEINLARAALIIASDEYPELAVERYLEKLAAMAERLAPQLPPGRSPLPCLDTLKQFLFDELGYSGNRVDYYDPRNSYLNDVLERKIGIPITLSIVYLDLARRLNLPLFGVGLPGHFLIKWEDASNHILIDPFNRGELLDPARVEELVRQTFLGQASLDPQWLAQVNARYILTRLLNNLKLIFAHTGNQQRAWQVLDKLLILYPGSAENLRDMGLLSVQLGAYRQAASCLEQYLLIEHNPADNDRVRHYLRFAQNAVEHLN